MSMVLSDILDDLSFNSDDIDTSELTDSMDQLTDATDQLLDGTKQLADGTGTLKEKVGQMIGLAFSGDKYSPELKMQVEDIEAGLIIYFKDI